VVVPPAIEAHELTKRFRRLQTYRDLALYPWRGADHLAVDRVSLAVAPGEVFGVLGQNGAGKTTLIRLLTTLLIPSSGEAVVAGRSVTRDPRGVRGLIGLVSGEERSFYWRLTGRQNLEFFAALSQVPADVARRRIDELVRRLGLSDHADRPFAVYSTGLRQKLAIARGLLSEPQVLFMDEPTRSLDPISARSIRQFVAEHVIGELGRTVVLATHSMTEAEELCDRLIFIQGGRVVSEGSVPELRRKIGYGVRCELRLRAMPETLPEAIRTVPGVLSLTVGRAGAASDPPHDHPNGLSTLRLTLAEETEVLARVLRTAVLSGAEVHGCETRELSLEEIYVRTLGQEQPAGSVVASR
jgi:ABC-2 type transport system ATP-binding protein